MPIENSPSAANGKRQMESSPPLAKKAKQNLMDAESRLADMQNWWGLRDRLQEAVINTTPLLCFVTTAGGGEYPGGSADFYTTMSSGGGYHDIWTLEKLGQLHNKYDSFASNAVEIKGLQLLKRALTARGGPKAQARALGNLIFREATNAHEAAQINPPPLNSRAPVSAPAPPAAHVPAAQSVPAAAPAVKQEPTANAPTDAPPVSYFKLSPHLPADAGVAIRLKPTGDSDQIARAEQGLVLEVVERLTNNDGEWLKLKLDGKDAYVMEVWTAEAGGDPMVLMAQCDENGLVPKEQPEEEVAQVGSITDGGAVAATLEQVIDERMTALEQTVLQKMSSMQKMLLHRMDVIEELLRSR
jgi:hypothetical protein